MASERYTFSNLKKVLANPRLLRTEAKYQSRRLNNWYFKLRNGSGVDILTQDWDNLFILDACRYDFFRDCNTIEGNLRPVASKGGHSRTFMEGNFVDREAHDTIYVTANLHADFLKKDVFYTAKLIPYSERNPERVAEATRELHEQYPDKRLIVHFMQPHKPYLGPSGEEIRERLRDSGLEQLIERGNYVKWEAYRDGHIPIEDLRKCYRENLEIALSYTEELIQGIGGKSVVTSDHGELLGESPYPFSGRLFGHPDNVNTDMLFTVPWLVIESDERRYTESELPIGFERLNSELAKKRLKELGYR